MACVWLNVWLCMCFCRRTCAKAFLCGQSYVCVCEYTGATRPCTLAMTLHNVHDNTKKL